MRQISKDFFFGAEGLLFKHFMCCSDEITFVWNDSEFSCHNAIIEALTAGVCLEQLNHPITDVFVMRDQSISSWEFFFFFFFFLFWLNLTAISLGLINIWHRLAAMSSASQQPRLMMGFFFFFFPPTRTWPTSICLLHLFPVLVGSHRLGPWGALWRSSLPPLLLFFTSSLRARGSISAKAACHQTMALAIPLSLGLELHRLAWRWRVIPARVVPVLLRPRLGICAPIWPSLALRWHHALLTQTVRRVESFSIWCKGVGGDLTSDLSKAYKWVAEWKTTRKHLCFLLPFLSAFWCVWKSVKCKNIHWVANKYTNLCLLVFLYIFCNGAYTVL